MHDDETGIRQLTRGLQPPVLGDEPEIEWLIAGEHIGKFDNAHVLRWRRKSAQDVQGAGRYLALASDTEAIGWRTVSRHVERASSRKPAPDVRRDEIEAVRRHRAVIHQVHRAWSLAERNDNGAPTTVVADRDESGAIPAGLVGVVSIDDFIDTIQADPVVAEFATAGVK